MILRTLAALLGITLLLGGCAMKTITVSRDEAYQAYQAEDYAVAARSFEALVQEIPQDTELWFRLGNSNARSGEPKKAITAFGNALLRDPSMAKAWHNLGIVHLQEALRTFIEMEKYVDPTDPVALRGRELREGIFQLLGESQKGPEEKE